MNKFSKQDDLDRAWNDAFRSPLGSESLVDALNEMLLHINVEDKSQRLGAARFIARWAKPDSETEKRGETLWRKCLSELREIEAQQEIDYAKKTLSVSYVTLGSKEHIKNFFGKKRQNGLFGYSA